jgi:aspartyl-tRNA(Asn)/glutamyl-tRNA(Gln) amidotransferase subunit A
MSAPSPLPRLRGRGLEIARALASSPFAGPFVARLVEQSLGISALRRLPRCFFAELPDRVRPMASRPARRWAAAGLEVCGVGTHASLDDYAESYRSGLTTPTEVVERAFDAIHRLGRGDPSYNLAVCLARDVAVREAETSTLRMSNGPRPLEGIPYLAKDQHDVAGLATRLGSSSQPEAAARDATTVARLRAAGAIVIGKSTMTEWGISPIGNSIHTRLPPNPYAPHRAAGGSSTGSAVAVALGVGPFATAGDAGGSVRIPAAFNGVVGLKPTFGRVSRFGEAFGGSMYHVGLVATSALDVGRVLDVIAATPDPADPLTLDAAPPWAGSFVARLGDGVDGLRIGVDETMWDGTEGPVTSACRSALAALEREGAVLVPIRIPLAKHAAAVGIATMGCEGVALARDVDGAEREGLAPDIQLAFAIAEGITAGDYLEIQRLRAGLRGQVASALSMCDVIASPTVPRGPPRMTSEERRSSFSDGVLIGALCRNTFLANLTGLPAASAPVGLDAEGMPIGLQILGGAWDEAGVLAVVAHLERCGVSSVARPSAAVDLVPRSAWSRAESVASPPPGNQGSAVDTAAE